MPQVLNLDRTDRALLRALTATPLDIVSVRPRRHSTLEERYLGHVGRA
jgi:hypothetical protein